MPVGIDEADARRVALEMVSGGSEPRVDWLRLVSGRQWNLIQRLENGEMSYCRCCEMWVDVPDDTAVYVAEVSASQPGWTIQGRPTERFSRHVVVDAQNGDVLGRDAFLNPDMVANLIDTNPPAPINAPPPGRLAALRARATATEQTSLTGGWTTVSLKDVDAGAIEHSATLAEVMAEVPLREGVRWTYHYSADAWLLPRVVTHTVALVQVVAPELAVVRIATEGGPGFMPEWLLIDHGNLYVATPDQASAWLRGDTARPTQTAPYAVLPPPPGHVGWPDGEGGIYLGPFSANSGVGRPPTYAAQYHGCSMLSYYGYPERLSDEVICPGIGWVARSSGSICDDERWTLIDFDPGPDADPSVRATAAWVLATATPLGEQP
jgi:hypothetical protein